MKESKCIIWDLDNTIWDGVLLEDKNVTLKEDISEIIKEIDKRGILQSIASKNNHEDAIKKLRKISPAFKGDEIFSDRIEKVAEAILEGEFLRAN